VRSCGHLQHSKLNIFRSKKLFQTEVEKNKIHTLCPVHVSLVFLEMFVQKGPNEPEVFTFLDLVAGLLVNGMTARVGGGGFVSIHV
jgi:hypothetical protein